MVYKESNINVESLSNESEIKLDHHLWKSLCKNIVYLFPIFKQFATLSDF